MTGAEKQREYQRKYAATPHGYVKRRRWKLKRDRGIVEQKLRQLQEENKWLTNS